MVHRSHNTPTQTIESGEASTSQEPMTDRFWILYRELVESVAKGPSDLYGPDPLGFIRDNKTLNGLRSYLTVWHAPEEPRRGETYPYELAQ